MSMFFVCVGDVSGDGHEKYSTFVFEATKPLEEVELAARKLNEVIPIFSMCRDYECSEFTDDEIVQLRSFLGDAFDPWIDLDSDEYIYPELYIDLFVACMNRFYPELELKQIDLPTANFGNIGYGLFY